VHARACVCVSKRDSGKERKVTVTAVVTRDVGSLSKFPSPVDQDMTIS
jgi:hypothetical protein